MTETKTKRTDEQVLFMDEQIEKRSRLYASYETQILHQFDLVYFECLLEHALLNGFGHLSLDIPKGVSCYYAAQFISKLVSNDHFLVIEQASRNCVRFFYCDKNEKKFTLRKRLQDHQESVVDDVGLFHYQQISTITCRRLLYLYQYQIQSNILILPIDIIKEINQYLFGVFPGTYLHQDDIEFTSRYL